MRVDLHTHSDASDGCDTPKQLLEAAAQIGIKLMAITDHDSIDNVAIAMQMAPQYGIQLIPGVEISSTAQGKDYHILAYNFDLNNKHLLDIIHYNNEMLRQKDIDTIERLAKLNWPVSIDEYNSYQAPKGVGGWQALNYLKSKGLCQDVNDFFQRIFIKENELAFPQFVSHTDVISTIHAAGGIAILAHAGSSFHGMSLKMPMEVFANTNLDGFECYHPGHDAQTERFLLDYCQQHNLISTAGSDYHGAFAPRRKLGFPEIYAQQLNLGRLLSTK